MPTRTAQGDLLSVAYLSHGDTQARDAAARLGEGML